MNSTRRLTLAAMLSALGVVLLILGSLVEVMDLVLVMLASLLVVFSVLELGRAWPYLTYGATALLALLILQLRLVVLEYVFFGGLYPIVKYWAEKLPRAISLPLKLIFINLSVVCVALVSRAVLGLGLRFGVPHFALLLLLCNAVFFLYDYALSRLIVRYLISIRPRIARLLK